MATLIKLDRALQDGSCPRSVALANQDLDYEEWLCRSGLAHRTAMPSQSQRHLFASPSQMQQVSPSQKQQFWNEFSDLSWKVANHPIFEESFEDAEPIARQNEVEATLGRQATKSLHALPQFAPEGDMQRYPSERNACRTGKAPSMRNKPRYGKKQETQWKPELTKKGSHRDVPPPPQPHPAQLGGAVISRGSKNHFLNQCRPCRNAHSPAGCLEGQLCNFCHYKHDDGSFEKELEKPKCNASFVHAWNEPWYAPIPEPYIMGQHSGRSR